MRYIIEVQKHFIPDNSKIWNDMIFGCYKHIGYIDTVFDDKKAVLNKIKEIQEKERKQVHIRFIVRQYNSEFLNIPLCELQKYFLNFIGPSNKVVIDKNKYSINIFLITDESHLLGIKKSLEHDDSGFVHNFNVLMKAFKNEQLYGIQILNQKCERPSYEEDPYSHELQLELGAIPALCLCYKDIDNKNATSIMWVHSAYRSQGLGTTFVKQLKINKAYHPISGSESFWRKNNVEMVN